MMKKKINARLVFVAILSILVTMILLLCVFYRLFCRQIMEDLKVCTNLLREYDRVEDLVDSGSSMEKAGVRITLTDSEGRVLFDNATTSSDMENHAERPEIRAAMETGEGQAIRRSDTLDRNTFYYAILLEDGNVLRVSREVGSMYSIFTSAMPILTVIILVLILLSFVIAHYLTRRLVEPVERLANNMEDQGTVYEELEPFIQMIRKQHQDILKSARIRQEFTANVTHELKTPLTSISGYAELIETGMASDQDVTRFAHGIHTNAKRLLTLINDILRLSELDAGDADITMERLNLYELAAVCVEMLRPSAESHAVTLKLQGRDCYINGNRMMIEELLYNLCDNAIRYNNENGVVTVEVCMDSKRNGYYPMLRISDTGIGIPKEHQERIFERFYRVDKSRSKSTGGTGLGLAIVKHIISIHGAQLDLESEEGKGTTIRVRFPGIV